MHWKRSLQDHIMKGRVGLGGNGQGPGYCQAEMTGPGIGAPKAFEHAHHMPSRKLSKPGNQVVPKGQYL